MKIIKYQWCSVAWLLMLSSTIYAGSNSTYDFLRNDVSARAAALGGSFITMSDDPNAIFYNPAGLGTLSKRKISFGYFKHLLDINSGYASFGSEIPGFGFIGAGIEYINYGEFKRTGEEGQDLGTFGAGDLALVAGYGGELQPGLKYGANVKFIYSSIAEVRSTGAAIDAGLQYVAIPNRLTLAMSLLNLGTQLDPYVNTRESLPVDFRIGAAVYPENLPAAILITFNKLNESQNKFTDRLKSFAVGIEFTVSPNVQLRVGYSNERRKELKVGSSAGLAGLSFGTGVAVEMYTFDYSYSSYGPIGALHRVSLGIVL